VTPPVVRLTAAYGAGLWTGLVFLLPAAWIWAAGVAGVALAARRRFAGTLTLAALVGVVTGGQQALERTVSCRERWKPQPRAATKKHGPRTGAVSSVSYRSNAKATGIL